VVSPHLQSNTKVADVKRSKKITGGIVSSRLREMEAAVSTRSSRSSAMPHIAIGPALGSDGTNSIQYPTPQ
jgi:hypothetical protein